jgi:hypothetical protein
MGWGTRGWGGGCTSRRRKKRGGAGCHHREGGEEEEGKGVTHDSGRGGGGFFVAGLQICGFTIPSQILESDPLSDDRFPCFKIRKWD